MHQNSPLLKKTLNYDDWQIYYIIMVHLYIVFSKKKERKQKAWRYQRGNRTRQWKKDRQTLQWSKEKGHKDKQFSTKRCTESLKSSIANPTQHQGECMCSGRVRSSCSLVSHLKKRNVRENRRGNQKWAILRNWQHRVHKTQDKDKQNKNTAQYMLDTTMCKQTQIMY